MQKLYQVKRWWDHHYVMFVIMSMVLMVVGMVLVSPFFHTIKYMQ